MSEAPPARARVATAVLLAAAAAVAFALRPADPDRALAERLIGPAARVPGGGPPAFHNGRKAVLFFERPGVQGLIRGAVVLEGDAVADVLVLTSTEGHDGRVLQSPGFLASFRGRPARPPVVVDSVTGASVSSRLLIDAVNDRLRWWSTEAPR
ncbi:MAG: FMN-binding protein [Planctomycetota bacterium]